MEPSNISGEIRKETKAKFDSLLKVALRKKSKSQQKLVSEDKSVESFEDGGHFNEAVEVDVHETEDKAYILGKFLNDSSREQEVMEPEIRVPVPKPRRKKSEGKEDKSSSTLTNESSKTLDLPKPKKREKIPRERTHKEIVAKQPSDEIEMIKVNSKDDFEEISQKSREDSIVKTPIYTYDKITSATIHRTDKLELDSYVLHPVVKIHLVDIDSGDYIKKSDFNRNVLFYNENKNINYIAPVMTQAYNLQEHRSLFPNWEEKIVINEDFKYLTNNHSVLIFFEIIDFLSMALVNCSSRNDVAGWHRIAWAFLKPTTPHSSNINKRVRLQLYRPNTPKKNCPPHTCDIYHWWLKRKFKKYPSTLYVSISDSISPETIIETLRSKAPHEVEKGKSRLQSQVTPQTELQIKTEENKLPCEPERLCWSRLENQTCKLPNKVIGKLDSYDNGCFVIKFSNSGLYLASAVVINTTNTIVIYSVLFLDDLAHLVGHQGLIYNINWSKDDKILITASADCTVCIWDAATYKFLQMLPHPSFVYASSIADNIIVTGCFDKYIRFWEFNDDSEYELKDELKGHQGFITCLSFNKNGTILYSSDSIGGIMMWKSNGEHWALKREVMDLKGVAVNQILLHKRERRILLNSRDNKICLVDIKTGYILQIYEGVLNRRIHMSCTFSPCGSYILSGSETGEVYVWSTETAKVQHIYRPYDLELTIHCVQYHPKDNYLAISHYENSLPILLYKNDGEPDEKSSLKTAVEENANDIKIDKVDKDNRSQEEVSVNFKDILKKMDNIISST